MKLYWILEHGDELQEGDEFHSSFEGFKPIHKNWYGCRISYEDSSTIANFKIVFRRPYSEASS